MRKTLRRFYTFDSGQAIYCTTENTTSSSVKDDPVIDVKPIKGNLIDAIRSVDEDHILLDIKKFSKKELLQIADTLCLLFDKE